MLGVLVVQFLKPISSGGSRSFGTCEMIPSFELV